ncbi:unnamed protein product [Adineta steineri]|uniref:Phage tail collar domain-containing protein n=1 Tax=Adineta steineri TaxID=433720 RepID=A0A814K3I7_9BILA|nr:unnamed protein product [Adineta steineri]CAF1558931.1 unnamed protein product [Adineta steineri]
MDKSTQTKLDLNMYGQVWSSTDLNPDRLTSELNKMFTYNQAETNYRNTSDKYYDFHEQYAKSLGTSAGYKNSASIFELASIGMEVSASLNKTESNATEKTTHDVTSLTNIKKYLDQKSIEAEWKGEKIIPKSFQVYKLTDITDNLQVALMVIELTAEKTNHAMIRTLSTLNLPPTFGAVAPTSVTQSSTCMTGEIRLYSANIDPPFPWLFCNGTAISRIAYQRLFSVIGESFGAGDGKTTFNVPDFRDRFPLGLNQIESRVHAWKKGGDKEQTLTIDQIPAHYHSAGSLNTNNAGTHKHTINDPGHNHGGKTGLSRGSYGGHEWKNTRSGTFDSRNNHSHAIPFGKTGIWLSDDGKHTHSIEGKTDSVGGGKSLSIMPPYQTIAYIIFTGATCA